MNHYDGFYQLETEIKDTNLLKNCTSGGCSRTVSVLISKGKVTEMFKVWCVREVLVTQNKNHSGRKRSFISFSFPVHALIR